jgi:hypothetical protein
MCHLSVRCRTDPFYWGCIFKCAGFSDEERLVGSQVYIPTCLPVALDEDGGSLQLCFILCTRKVEDLCNWIYVVIFDAIVMIIIFFTVMLSIDPWNSTVTQEFCL